MAKRFRRISDTIRTNSGKSPGKIAVRFIEAVAPITPVNTGKAVSNWRVSINPVSAVRPPYSTGVGGSTKSACVQGAIDQARSFVESRSRARAFYASNTVPYIGKLNSGSSAQAPAGFVEKALNEAKRGIRSVEVLEGI